MIVCLIATVASYLHFQGAVLQGEAVSYKLFQNSHVSEIQEGRRV